MPQPFAARSTSLLGKTNAAGKVDHLPGFNDLGHKWMMAASSSSLWLDQKQGISVTYVDTTQSSNTASSLNDQTTYTTIGSLKQTTTMGVSTPLDSHPGLFNWRGAGWLRMVSAQWEVVGFGTIKGGDSLVLVVAAAKTLFSPQGLSVYYREGHPISGEDVDWVKNGIRELDDPVLTAEVDLRQYSYV
ncbi:unnamed protein product [Clonostachys solani]|uniref:Uncharacterized protein n=1 Tax=Clonostachys solani TaxID=160281 RepID=A0A9N9ZB07_9HYPO|nr:unnamed protein product [Clonostachys solani]